jgi:hypothetical protein
MVEPFYVAGGFMLYLNRRTELEAWDVELGFRRLAQRLKALGTSAMLALCLGLTALGTTPPLHAEENTEVHMSSSPLAAEEAGRVIKEVLADEDFATSRNMTLWLPKDFELDVDEDKRLEDEPLFPGLPILLADGLKLVLLVLLIVGIGYLVHNRDRLLAGFRIQPRMKDKTPPTTLFGMDIQPASLPQDIAGASRRLWQQGEHRQALSLLYRGSLSRLVNDHHLALHDSMTEGDILRSAQHAALSAELVDFLHQLTLAWQTVAYAHRQPPTATIEILFHYWPGHFDKAASI